MIFDDELPSLKTRSTITLSGLGEVTLTDNPFEQLLIAAYFTLCKPSGKNHIVGPRGPAFLEEAGVVFTDKISARTALIVASAADPLTGLITIPQRTEGIPLAVDITHTIGKFAVEGDILFFKHGITGIDVIPTPRADADQLEASLNQAIDDQADFCLRLAAFRDQMEEQIEEIPGCHVLYRDRLRLPNITVVATPGIHGNALSHRLRIRGVQVPIANQLVIHWNREIPFPMDILRAEIDLLRHVAGGL